MLKITLTNKTTQEQSTCSSIVELQQCLNAAPTEIIDYLSRKDFIPTWQDSEWGINLVKIPLPGDFKTDYKDVMVLDYVKRCIMIYDDSRAVYNDIIFDHDDIRSRLTTNIKRIDAGKYLGGYEFFFMANISPKKLPKFLNISYNEALGDRVEYLATKIKQLLNITEDVIAPISSKPSKLLIYETPNGKARVEPLYRDDTLWMTRKQIAELFETTKQNIGQHVSNIINEGELTTEAVVKKIFTTASDGKQYNSDHYSLGMIIAIGYRVNSKQATLFRIWATTILREYLIKGFALDDERLKNGGDPIYQQELINRIQDIRSSEKVAWQKMRELFATSIDYNPDNTQAKLFFATIQNKLHWAAHGHTAAEIVYQRADATKPHAGMTNFIGFRPTRIDATIAKSYLHEQELLMLNKLTAMYLDFAEVRAINGEPMKMGEWLVKLDEFITVTERELLDNKGSISHDDAINKAMVEYWQYINTMTENDQRELAILLAQDDPC